MTECGGCKGGGSHRRWCPEVVGAEAARLGLLAEEAEALGDRIGASHTDAANYCYRASGRLVVRAAIAAEAHRRAVTP